MPAPAIGQIVLWLLAAAVFSGLIVMLSARWWTGSGRRPHDKLAVLERPLIMARMAFAHLLRKREPVLPD